MAMVSAQGHTDARPSLGEDPGGPRAVTRGEQLQGQQRGMISEPATHLRP